MDASRTSLGELELFIDAAQLGSLREVARSRGMEVAQLSRTLQRLEKRLGKRLFQRSSRGLLLTPEGQELRNAVERGLAELGIVSQRSPTARRAALSLEGVGAPSFLMDDLVLPLIGRLTNLSYIESAKVVELPPDRLVLSGLRGIINVAFHAGELEWPRSWVSEPIGHLPWGLYASRKFFAEKSLSEEELSRCPFVYPLYWSPEGLREGEDRCPLPLRYRKKSIGVSSGWMALELLDTHPSVSYLPSSLVSRHEDRFCELSVEGWAKVAHPLYVSAHADRMSQQTLRRIVSECRKFLARP